MESRGLWSRPGRLRATGSSASVQAPSRGGAWDAGLLDKLHVDLVAVLLGDGIRFFDKFVTAPVLLDSPRVIEGTCVTRLSYRVRPGAWGRRRSLLVLPSLPIWTLQPRRSPPDTLSA